MTTTVPRPADYTATFSADATPETVFDALTTPRGLAAWWSPVTGEGTEGGELRFHMGAPEGPLVIDVHTARAARVVVWDVRACPFLPDWDGTTIVFDLSGTDTGGCEVFFRHHGLTAELDCFDTCRRGWDHFLPSLATFSGTGSGSPLGSAADMARR